jgi:histidine triad (HIT) family protein/ATP adenylyltransferase
VVSRAVTAERNTERVKIPFDVDAYTTRSRTGPCFVCALVAGEPGAEHHIVLEDDEFIGFLARWPTLLGYCLVAPKRHVEDWVDALAEDEFLRMQTMIRRLASALKATVPTERVYSMSLGSRQGNAHLHWHVATLPPGVPYERQQYHALMSENGVLDVDEAGQRALAAEIRERLKSA